MDDSYSLQAPTQLSQKSWLDDDYLSDVEDDVSEIDLCSIIDGGRAHYLTATH